MSGPSKQDVSFVVAAVVGTILVAINHGDTLLNGGAANWFKIILTYLVPYAVLRFSLNIVCKKAPV